MTIKKEKSEADLSEEAFEWIKGNHKLVIEKFVDSSLHVVDSKPVTLFMAGSPGAGKSEIAIRLAEKFKAKPVIIDADEIRKICKGYTGSNAHIFQKAASRGVHILYEYVLKNNLNVILDGTFAYTEWQRNIERSIKRGRKVELYYVYQEPIEAWNFTKAREVMENRRVSKEVFIKAFIKSRENANEAKKYFGDKLEMHLIIKNNSNHIERFELNIANIDYFIKKQYDINELKSIII